MRGPSAFCNPLDPTYADQGRGRDITWAAVPGDVPTPTPPADVLVLRMIRGD